MSTLWGEMGARKLGPKQEQLRLSVLVMEGRRSRCLSMYSLRPTPREILSIKCIVLSVRYSKAYSILLHGDQLYLGDTVPAKRSPGAEIGRQLS